MQELLEKGMPEDGLGAVFSGIRTKNGPEAAKDSRLFMKNPKDVVFIA